MKKYAATFLLTAERASKLHLGKNKTLTALYGVCTRAQLAAAPHGALRLAVLLAEYGACASAMLLRDGGVKANPSAHSASGMAGCELHRQPLERCRRVLRGMRMPTA